MTTSTTRRVIVIYIQGDVRKDTEYDHHYVQQVKKKRKKEHPYLFQYKLSYRNETGTNHHGLLSTSV